MQTVAQALRQGIEHHQRGQWLEAEKLYRQALEADANCADAWHLLGLAAHARGDLAGAIEAMREALRVNPRLPATECSLGAFLQMESRVDEAIACYHRALAVDPNFAQAHCNLGIVWKDRGEIDEALQCYRRALECNPALAEAHFNLGALLQELHKPAEAEQCYRRAILARPDYALAYSNLGLLLQARGELQQAADCFARAIDARPDCVDAWNHLGNAHRVEGRVDEARACYERATRARPDYAPAHFNLAQLLLADGDFAGGWREYEWRWKCPEFPSRPYRQPRWQGEPLAGRTLLVHAEQGLGDTIQFVRYLRPLAERVGTILLEVPPALIPLLKLSPLAPLARLVAAGDPLPQFDAHVPLLSLPGILGTTPETIPAAEGYLAADPQTVRHWRRVLGDSAALKVGIVWQGRPGNSGDRFRSNPLRSSSLAGFAPLALPGVELISLQKGLGAEQLADPDRSFQVRNLGDDFDRARGAFVDTAAVMKCLDLVVTVDTATVHLAGALGVETWVALPLAPDWRWMHERSDTPWYKSVRLFRQSRAGGWPEVFARMADELRLRLAQPGET